MPTRSLSEAYADACVNAPPDVVVLDTLEIWHAAFQDEQGAPAPIYVVVNLEPITARIEADAARNAGQTVTFQPCALSLDLPSVEEGKMGQARLSVSRVGSQILPYLLRAAATIDQVWLTYRAYAQTDLSQPGMVVADLTLHDVKAASDSVSGVASWEDVHNRVFGSRYRATRQIAPGLYR